MQAVLSSSEGTQKDIKHMATEIKELRTEVGFIYYYIYDVHLLLYTCSRRLSLWPEGL